MQESLEKSQSQRKKLTLLKSKIPIFVRRDHVQTDSDF